jgi:outer membrane murein-binding lipoprotein Lpp
MPGHVSVPNGGTSSGSTAAEKAMSNSSGPHTLPGGSSKVKMGQSASASQELSSFVFEHV